MIGERIWMEAFQPLRTFSLNVQCGIGDAGMMVQRLIALYPARDDWRMLLDGDCIEVPDCGNSRRADFQRGIGCIETLDVVYSHRAA